MKSTQDNPAGSLRKKQKAETYALILNVAGDMFESMGYEKTTLRKVAAEAGMTPGAIFKHFENKSALLAAKLYDDIEVVQERAINSIPQETTVENQFLHIAESFFKYYEVRPSLSKILVKHSIFTEGQWAQKIKGQIDRLGNKLVELIEAGKNRNEIKKNVENATLATTLWSNYIFALMLMVNTPESDSAFALEILKPLAKQTLSGTTTDNIK